MPSPNATHSSNFTSIPEVARRYGVSERTIRRRISDGSLRAYRMGPRVIRIDADDVADLFEVIPTTDPAA